MFVFLIPGEIERFDLQHVLSGEHVTNTKVCLTAVSAVTAGQYELSAAQSSLLSNLSATTWTSLKDITRRFEIDEKSVTVLAQFGLLISDSQQAMLAGFRRRDEDLKKLGWNRYAALQYAMSKWHDVDAMKLSKGEQPGRIALEKSTRREFNKNTARHGPSPGHFAKPRGSGVDIMLPVEPCDSSLQRILNARETCRDFAPQKPVNIKQLSTILYHAFGCHGYYELSDDLVVLKKTSPSGGSLHPIEAYPFIQNVVGLATGIYQYSVRDHTLMLIKSIDEGKTGDLAVHLTAGQEHFRHAHVLLFLTCRFARHNWKYRNHDKAYRVVLLDAGHLSQSVYLLCTELGLGAFITGAINEQNIEELLSIDGISEGVVAVLGFGVRSMDADKLSPPFHSYHPGKTTI